MTWECFLACFSNVLRSYSQAAVASFPLLVFYFLELFSCRFSDIPLRSSSLLLIFLISSLWSTVCPVGSCNLPRWFVGSMMGAKLDPSSWLCYSLSQWCHTAKVQEKNVCPFEEKPINNTKQTVRKIRCLHDDRPVANHVKMGILASAAD